VPLVQFPDCWVAGISMVAGPVAWVVDAAVVVVEPPAPEAAAEPAAVVVVVVDAEAWPVPDDPPPAVDAFGGGSL
jgi:hypothetical protein